MLLIAAVTANPAGESRGEVLMLDFDRRPMLQLHGPGGASDAGLLAPRELDDALGLTTMAGRDARRRAHGPEWLSWACRGFLAVSIWPFRGIRGHERRRATAA